LLQLQLFHHWKDVDHPILKLFHQSPQSFLEVRMELALSRFSAHGFNHMDVDQASKAFQLTSFVSKEARSFTKNKTFFGYHTSPKDYPISSELIQKIRMNMDFHLRSIYENEECCFDKVRFTTGESSTVSIKPSQVLYTPGTKKPLRFSVKRVMKLYTSTERLFYDPNVNTAGNEDFPDYSQMMPHTDSSEHRSWEEVDASSDGIPEGHYIIEDIIDHELVDGELMFRVKWLGYPNEDAQWKRIEDLNCPELLEAYIEYHPSLYYLLASLTEHT